MHASEIMNYASHIRLYALAASYTVASLSLAFFGASHIL